MTRSKIPLVLFGAKGALATLMLAMVVNLAVPATPAQAGILGGAVGGAVIGGIVGGRRGARAGAVVGGIAGAIRR
jgi:outer membrane lipoprotein SlyB